MQAAPSRSDLEYRAAAALELRRRQLQASPVYGILSPKKELLRCIQEIDGEYKEVDRTPVMYVQEKLERFITVKKSIKVAIGGRASGKSVGIGDILTMKMQHEACDVYCLREFWESASNSIHRVFKGSIQKRLNLPGWTILENKVIAPNGAHTVYKGANRNPDSMQSAEGYKYSLFEEAHRASQPSLDKLLPTIIRTKGSECWFIGNPQLSTDPFSKRFIVPYQAELDKYGWYEDDMHLIIVMNWDSNPWFTEESAKLRNWDKKHQTLSKYQWIWEGKYYDSLENSIIFPEWFDACIDAHKKLGFSVDEDGKTELTGNRVAALDPKDVGKDANGYIERAGVVFTCVDEIEAENGNRAFDKASLMAKQFGADTFGWDCDGMGALLRDQAETNFKGSGTQIYMYKGSTAVNLPESPFKAENTMVNMQEERKNKDVFANKKAQNNIAFAERIFKTYEAVTKGRYHDPDDLISFDSETIKPEMLAKLKAETCKTLLKPGDKIKFYTKEELRKGVTMADGNKMVIPSGNLFDAAVLSLDKASILFDNGMDEEEIVFTSIF
jgi:phage terminase large subunit